MAGMFWHNNHPGSTQIDSLLDQEDVTLHKLMDAEDILQECKSINKKLIDFLTRPEVLEELVDSISKEPSNDLEEKSRYKYANIACELLTCDVPIITEKLAGNEALLSKLYSFIDTDQALNPLLASFFSKTLHALFRRASDQNWYSHQFVCLYVLEFIKSQKGCVGLLLRHIETSAIMDLLLILITKIEDDEMRQNILYWLDEEQIISKLVGILSPSLEPSKHENAAQLLCDVIEAARQEPEKKLDSILATLQSDDTVKLLLDTILSGIKEESSLIGGISVLLILLGEKEIQQNNANETYSPCSKNTVDDEQRNKIALIIVPYLDKLVQLLLEPPEKPPVKTTMGLLEKPFGLTRLYILKLICKLLSTENPEVKKKLKDISTFKILMDLFFEFSWNNFLHTEVEQCLALALNCDSLETNETIYKELFVNVKLIERICEAWDENDRIVANKEKVGVRQGYIGHLIVIGNNIVKCSKENSELSSYLKINLSEETLAKWDHFTSVELEEANKMQQISLGDPPDAYMSSSDVSDEFANFPQDSYGQNFNNFQDQSPYSDYESNFPNEKNEDGDENNPTEEESVNSEVFNSADYGKSMELFNEMCEKKMFDEINICNSLEHNKLENWDDWDDKYQPGKPDWINGIKQHSSSSSDEEDKDDTNNFYINTDESVDPWNSLNTISGTKSNSLNVWNVDVPEHVEQTGWANFENAFSNEHSNEIKTDTPVEAPISSPNIKTSPESNVFSKNEAEEENCLFKTGDTTNVPSLESSISNSDKNANHTFVDPTFKEINKSVDQKDLDDLSASTDEETISQIVDGLTEKVAALLANDNLEQSK